MLTLKKSSWMMSTQEL